MKLQNTNPNQLIPFLASLIEWTYFTEVGLLTVFLVRKDEYRNFTKMLLNNGLDFNVNVSYAEYKEMESSDVMEISLNTLDFGLIKDFYVQLSF